MSRRDEDEFLLAEAEALDVERARLLKNHSHIECLEWVRINRWAAQSFGAVAPQGSLAVLFGILSSGAAAAVCTLVQSECADLGPALGVSGFPLPWEGCRTALEVVPSVPFFRLGN